MWLEAAVRTIEAALPFFLNTIEASKMLSRKQLSAAVYTHAVAIFGVIFLKSATLRIETSYFTKPCYQFQSYRTRIIIKFRSITKDVGWV